METPSSTTRRVTRSQALAALNNIPISRRIEDSDQKGVSKSRQKPTKQQQDRSAAALIDITNDSPIVGVATGGLETPSSAMSKQRRTIRAINSNTPGSGETLLRCQVKTLLQKVEEEAELSKISMETNRPYLHLQGFGNSPLRLLAPTPANTPQILNLNEDDDDASVAINDSLVVQEQLISEVISDMFDIQESIESDINLISRSLLLDFSEKTESTECSSVVTDDDNKEKPPCPDEDDSSVWSIQVNGSSIHDEDIYEEEQVVEDESCNDNYEEYDAGLIDELCQEMGKVSVNNNNNIGRHTRFLYNSDDEIVEEEEPASGVSPNILCFKGLPTPNGKHIRFAIEEEEIE